VPTRIVTDAPSDALVRRTRWAAFLVLAWLAALVLGSGFAAAVLLSVAEEYAHSAAFQIVLCLTGGLLGASMLALLSAGERIARGWSYGVDALAAGERRFHARLAPLLALQPILGAAVGMLLLLALSAGSVMLLRLSEGTTFDPMGLLLASAIAGLLARGLLARVRDAADALFGARTPMAVATAGRSAPPAATVGAAAPAALSEPAASAQRAEEAVPAATVPDRAVTAGPMAVEPASAPEDPRAANAVPLR
jgi:hypothetical protein